ncbi:MAG: alpha-mannosidase, partial [Patescibacteria group bacterium]|nr:alpha-mannosidase [Patescibacteria group bacterium]
MKFQISSISGLLIVLIALSLSFQPLYSQVSPATPVTAHMIGHHHIDLIWLWPWEESVEVARATWQSVLDRMDEYPDIRFLQNSAAAYEWIEDIDPVMFQKITQRIKEGRWVIVGGWWVEPDCNVPSGESFVRQGLYGKRYFKSKFDVDVNIGYNPDSFGHNWMLPQILTKLGYKYYMFMRPNYQENTKVPADVFWWESPDGSRVLTYRITSYAATSFTEEQFMRRYQDETKNLNNGLHDILMFYGMGNHGGVMTKTLLNTIQDFQKKFTNPQIIFSDPIDFIKKVEQSGVEFPVHKDDLQYHAQGCYSTIASIKKMNRENENLLGSAEKFSVIADVLQRRPYPKQKITHAWQKVLFNQFHDIMPGSSIGSAYVDVIACHGQARMIAREALNSGTQSIQKDINTQEQTGIPIVVWNPHGHEVTAPAEVELAVVEGEMPPHMGPLVDNTGVSIPHQLEPGESYMGRSNRRLVVFYPTVPAMGYKTFWLKPGDYPTAQSYPLLSVKEDSKTVTMENSNVSITINKETGYVDGLKNLKENVITINQPAAVPVVIQDSSDTWSHDVLEFHNEVGKFENAEILVMERGPVRARVRVKSYYNKSSLVQDFILYGEGKQVEVRAAIDWRETLKMFKMAFPVNIQKTRSFYAIPFGYIERTPNGHENPGGPYLVAQGLYEGKQPAGLALLNDSKYGFDVKDNVMSITIQRSPVYAQHRPYVLKPGIEYPYMD